MIVLVIGLGSMGRRRIGLIKEIDESIEIIGVDNNENRRNEARDLLAIKTFAGINDAIGFKKADCAFVCTSPVSHADVIEECLQNNLHVFTEINLLSDKYDSNMELAGEKGKTLFLSSTFLYRSEIDYLNRRVGECHSPLNYIYHVGQYLPDWHPWENYKDFFVGNKKTNGCREIFAIELPWIVTVFGNIANIEVEKKKISSLNIDYPDSFFVKISHENGNTGVMMVDVVSRKAVRKLDAYNEDIYITWNGKIDSVTDFDIFDKTDKSVSLGEAEHKEGYADFISENPYRDEIIDFFDVVSGKKSGGKWDFIKDKAILEIIDKIEM